MIRTRKAFAALAVMGIAAAPVAFAQEDANQQPQTPARPQDMREMMRGLGTTMAWE